MAASFPWRRQPIPVVRRGGSADRRIGAAAMIEYFAPLKIWLDEQNKLLAATDQNVK